MLCGSGEAKAVPKDANAKVDNLAGLRQGNYGKPDMKTLDRMWKEIDKDESGVLNDDELKQMCSKYLVASRDYVKAEIEDLKKRGEDKPSVAAALKEQIAEEEAALEGLNNVLMDFETYPDTTIRRLRSHIDQDGDGHIQKEEFAKHIMTMFYQPKELSVRLSEPVLLNQGIGMVRFFGRVDFADGEWIGVEMIEPVGKNDGTVKGKKYFECKDKHGIFVKIEKIERKLEQKVYDAAKQEFEPTPILDVGDIKEEFIDTKFGKVLCRRFGDQSEERLLLILHSNKKGANGLDNNWLVGALRARTFDVAMVSMDLPGFGKTEVPPSAVNTPGKKAQLFEEVIIQLGFEKAAVYAEGQSGGTVLEVAAYKKGVFPKLVLVNPLFTGDLKTMTGKKMPDTLLFKDKTSVTKPKTIKTLQGVSKLTIIEYDSAKKPGWLIAKLPTQLVVFLKRAGKGATMMMDKAYRQSEMVSPLKDMSKGGKIKGMALLPMDEAEKIRSQASEE